MLIVATMSPLWRKRPRLFPIRKIRWELDKE